MTSLTAIRYLHFVGILTVASTLFAELILIKRTFSERDLKLISRVDSAYGIGALVAILTGLSQWFLVGKPAEFYSSNPVFIIKITLFGLVGILSIWPTVFFVRNRSAEHEVTAPGWLKPIVLSECLILLILPLLAVLMASGYRF